MKTLISSPFPLLFMLFVYDTVSFAGDEPVVIDKLLAMSMEQLMTIDVTIATRNKKPLSTIAAPVFVISADDIRRSGAANIPEALRMAPGLQVSQVNNHDWAVTIRGFNDVSANKVLVLVDGRSIYSGFNSGTYWRDVQAMPLESIERIEIIRGSGGVIWGTGAVNGVINIITRSAQTTKGGQLTLGAGSVQQGFGRFDQTYRFNDSASVRGYGSYFNVADAQGTNHFIGNGGYGWRSGARFDWNSKHGDALMVDAAWYENTLENTLLSSVTYQPPYTKAVINQPNNHQGGHLLTRWEHHLNDKNYWALRAYYDYVKRNDDNTLGLRTDTFDIDFTHYFSLGDAHNLTWGAGYRRINDDASNSISFRVDPRIGHIDIYNVFAQDAISLDDAKKWQLTLASKVEYYSLTKFEVEPAVSLSWQFSETQTLWGSVSHAVRVPTRSQSDIGVLIFAGMDGNTPVIAQGQGKKGIDAENETAYQIGWRGAFGADFTAELTAFYASYNDLTRIEQGGKPSAMTDFAVAPYFIPLRVGNNLQAQTYGAELNLSWQATDWWRNYFSYSLLKIKTQPYAGHILNAPHSNEKDAPQQQVSLRTNFNVTNDVDFDLWWRYTDAIQVNGLAINAYPNLDVRLAWRPLKQVELSLIGQNLIQTHHTEWHDDLLLPQTTYISRGVYAKILWQF